MVFLLTDHALFKWVHGEGLLEFSARRAPSGTGGIIPGEIRKGEEWHEKDSSALSVTGIETDGRQYCTPV